MTTRLEPSDPDTPATYWIGWHDVLVSLAERRIDVLEGMFLRYQIDTGFYYEVTAAGRLSELWPTRLPRASGQTLSDGSAILTCRHPSDASLSAIASAAWSLQSGLSKDSQQENGFFTLLTVSDGVDGEEYECTCLMTPTVGNAREKTIIIPRISQ